MAFIDIDRADKSYGPAWDPDGPEAGIGEVIEVNFPRPRERKGVLEHPDYYKLRERLIEFLEVHAHKKQPALATAAASPVLTPALTP